MPNLGYLFDRVLRIYALRWQRIFQRSSILKGLCSRVSLVIFDDLTKERCIAAHLFCKRVIQLVRKSGYLATALYLKQCSTSLQTAYGSGGKIQPTLLPVPVSLTRQNSPRIIPKFHRLMMYKRDSKADKLVQLYLSFFSVSKVIVVAKPISKDTLKSIVQPTDLDAIVEVVSKIKGFITPLTYRYLPWISSIGVNQGMSWVPTWKALTSDRLMKESIRAGVPAVPSLKQFCNDSSVFTSLFWELAAYTSLMNFEHAYGAQFSSGVLWAKFTRFAYDPLNTYWVNTHLSWFERAVGPYLPSPQQMEIPFTCGRLGMSLEGAGKRRIFAIGNYVKQRLLFPYHDWLMKLLASLPNDGTFNQTAPLDYLVGINTLYSFDLKSATGLFILCIQL